jgi:hypothetical protein
MLREVTVFIALAPSIGFVLAIPLLYVCARYYLFPWA